MVAAHDIATYERLSDLTSRLYKLDSDIAVAGQQFRQSRKDGLKALQLLYMEAQQLHPRLPDELAKVISLLPAK